MGDKLNIYLVGFMGTGKTTVGRMIADSKKRRFVDLDELIELREKRSIADIFAKEGEGYFRELEGKTLEEVAGSGFQVVACGGGIVISPVNIEVMKKTGKIICLTANPEVILKRTQGYSHRPLLNVDNPAGKIKELLEKRAQFYALSDMTIDTSELSIKEVADEIVKVL